jgi:hypothetical protein
MAKNRVILILKTTLGLSQSIDGWMDGWMDSLFIPLMAIEGDEFRS